MTLHTIRNIAQSFLIVFINHLLLIVAVITSVSLGVVTRMASFTLVVGVAVIHREGVVERRSGEGVGVVAVGALTGVMVGGRRMAGGAIG